MTRVYAQNRKQLFQLTEKIGEGGEGTVFAWPSDPLRVCKVYHDDVLHERGDVLTRKLAAMLSAPPDDPMLARGNPTFAWPEGLVFNAGDHKRLVGFVMPRIHESHSLHRLYSAGDRKQLTSPTDREGRPLPEYYVMVATARNLAEAFRLLHARGYVMADVNEDNIRFRVDATVSLIDNDSFQVRDRSSGEKFLVPVLKAEYWPVDSLEVHDRGEALTVSHDQFCLALFLFRLLMNGVHPFHGMGAAGADPPSSVENIAAGRFPFLPAHSGGLRPPLYAPAYDGIPADLRELFRSCFVEGARNPSARADAGTWVKALDRAHKTLKRCQRGHLHFTEARLCPWCELEDARVSCPKGHRYYRAEGSCPQCRLEQRRAARISGTPSQPTTVVSVPIPFRPAPQPPAVPVPPPPVPRRAPVAFPGYSALRQNPKVIRWGLVALLLAVFTGANIWGPLHLFAGPAVTRPLAVKVNPHDGAGMVLIPAGSFLMGDGDVSNNRRHTVTLSGYWIYKNDVTVAMYRRFCAATGRQMPDAPSFGWQDDNPIVNVTWDDAKAYCDWAGVSLPTEAQWEKAARGIEGREYPWGDDWEAGKCANSVDSKSLQKTMAVGSYPDGASPYGVLDMAGNVWQWCSDWYVKDFYKSAPNRNPTGPASSPDGRRVLRGASCYDTNPGYFRAATRTGNGPTIRSDDNGFRGASGL